jgi:hypothetical protein
MRMTRIGREVLHTGAVGVIVAQHDVYVEVQVPGEHGTRLLLNRVADEPRTQIVRRASFVYKPGDVVEVGR